MRILGYVTGACLAGWLAVAGACAAPLLRVVKPEGVTNLIRNPGFEERPNNNFTGWSASANGYAVALGEGRNGSTALRVLAPDETGWRGASQSLTLNRTNPAPLVVSGWSRAEAVSGGADNNYSLYVDLIYADGTPLWGQTANFSPGTHDWQFRQLTILPDKPVRSLTLYCLFRGHAGQAWFDDVSISEVKAGGDAVLFQGTPMQIVPETNPPPAATSFALTADGLRLGLAGSRVVSFQLDGTNLASGQPGGFFARDVAADSDVFGFENGECAELGLRLAADFESRADHVRVRGRLQDTRGVDRAVLLLFALPVEAAGWTWGDDIRRTQVVAGNGEFINANSVGCGTTGALSTYPLAALSGPHHGVALAVDMGRPAQFRLFHHAGTRQLCLALDLGLVPETQPLAGGAEFEFVLYRFAPRWGFRAAFDRLMRIFPDYFAVRSREQGIWMPFTDVGSVQDWADFGFRYHEGDNAVAWDDAHGVLSFRYTEPMTWWMPMAPALPRTEAEALRVRDEYAAGSAGTLRDFAQISRAAAMYNRDQQAALLFRNEPWANGAVWSLNPNPALPATPNAATVYWNDAVKSRLYGPGATARLDGEYLDSLEGYVTADLNFRRDHFRWSSVPLTFATDTRQPALFKGLAVYEFTRWISDDVHRLGGLVFANGVPYRFAFLCPWLDVLGTETDWLPGGTYQPVSHAQLALWRTLSGGKPYLLLMNTDYNQFTPDLVERYFQRSLFYGMFPSMFSHNASENPYWRNPAWYNRDRPLFKKYLPIIKPVAEAGWRPLTGATCSNTNLWLERFGPDAAGRLYLTALNTSGQSQTGSVTVSRDETGLPPGALATELLAGQRLAGDGDAWPLAVPANGVRVIRLEPGPRFVQWEAASPGRVRLTIESPVALPQVLETSPDLQGWQALETHEPSAGRYTVEVANAGGAGEFFRLRW